MACCLKLLVRQKQTLSESTRARAKNDMPEYKNGSYYVMHIDFDGAKTATYVWNYEHNLV